MSKSSQFTGLNCHTVLVSFGKLHGAVRWLKEMNTDLDMITDERRLLYKFFELKVSYVKVWTSETLMYYAEQKLLGKKLPSSYEDVEDDPHQMGGDFILKFNGERFEVVFEYPSQIPPDRPSPQSLVEFLNEQ